MNIRLLLLSSLLTPLAFAIQPGAQSKVTLSLVRHDSAPVSETSPNSKLVKYSYGNKQLLEELLDEGVLGDGETSISGWKLVVVDHTPLVETDGSTLVFYAVKKDVTPVQIPSSRLYLDASSEVGADGDTYKTVDEELVLHKSSFKSLVVITGHAEIEGDYSYSFSLQGLASGTNFRTTKKFKVDDMIESYDYSLLGAVTLKPVLGTYTDNDPANENPQTPVEGGITFSAFTALDISGYPYEAAPIISTE